MKSPAPNKYRMIGDFDLKDGDDPEKPGKKARFHFGTKTEIKERGIDIPGPGTYRNVLPLKNNDTAHVIGTSIRYDPRLEKARNYPGPGSYLEEINELKPGPHVGFT